MSYNFEALQLRRPTTLLSPTECERIKAASEALINAGRPEGIPQEHWCPHRIDYYTDPLTGELTVTVKAYPVRKPTPRNYLTDRSWTK